MHQAPTLCTQCGLQIEEHEKNIRTEIKNHKRKMGDLDKQMGTDKQKLVALQSHFDLREKSTFLAVEIQQCTKAQSKWDMRHQLVSILVQQGQFDMAIDTQVWLPLFGFLASPCKSTNSLLCR